MSTSSTHHVLSCPSARSHRVCASQHFPHLSTTLAATPDTMHPIPPPTSSFLDLAARLGIPQQVFLSLWFSCVVAVGERLSACATSKASARKPAQERGLRSISATQAVPMPLLVHSSLLSQELHRVIYKSCRRRIKPFLVKSAVAKSVEALVVESNANRRL